MNPGGFLGNQQGGGNRLNGRQGTDSMEGAEERTSHSCGFYVSRVDAFVCFVLTFCILHYPYNSNYSKILTER